MMKNKHVVITGTGAVSPFGVGVGCLWENLSAGQSAVKMIPSLKEMGGLRSIVAATVPEIDVRVIDRKKRRFMSPMSIYSCIAALEAIEMSGLPDGLITSRQTGLCLASTMGSSAESESFFRELARIGSIENTKSTMFFKTMNHSCASNTAQALGIRGRVVSPSAACATGTLAIGLAYEAILSGAANIMICGGTDEHHVLATAVFDILSAASCNYNDDPHQTPRPFDVDRDGVVCAEGAGIVILEELDHARERGVNILGEIIGFATFSSPGDIANSDSETMADCMRCVLSQAGISAEDVGYVNAHATATIQGDIAEARAISKAVGDKVPVSSLKGHLGHTMAASGALELIASLEMMHKGVLISTRNLVTPDPECDVINLILTNEDITENIVLKNSFALGGINATILIRRNIHD